MADVIVIQGNQAVQQEKPKLRVCAYARVSSKSYEQQYSFFGQVQHYTRLINENLEWKYVDIYADEGLTGARKDKRDEFNRMIDDCRAGKIDKILTKAVSRLARNISECVEVVKELKELGVTVYFEEQQLDSGRPSDFTAICVYAAIAQEESISIAQNMRMSCSARMKLGTYKQVNAPYGYYIENDEFKINEEQAQVVRVIFRAYIEGKSIYKIADELNQAGVPTKFGGVTWRIKDISYILSNVRYKGDALLQKSYRDGFPYKAKKNRGEKDKYYKYNANVPIVSREEFDKAEKLLSKRRELYYSGRTIQEHSFSHMIICRECGSIYRKKDRVNGKYAWVCRQHDFGIDKCASKPIDDACIRKAYILMYNRLKENQEYILHPMLSQIETIRTSSAEKNLIKDVNIQIAQTTEQVLSINRLKAKGLIEPVSYMEESNRLNEQIIKLRKQKKKFQQKNEFDKVIDNTRKLLKEFEITGAIAEFNKEQFRRVVQKIYADSDTLTFKFINNMELDIRIEKVL